MSDSAAERLDADTIASRAIAERFMTEFPVEAAHELETMDVPAAARCLDFLPLDAAAKVWLATASGFGVLVFKALEAHRRTALLGVLDRSRAAELLSLLDQEDRSAELAAVPEGLQQELRTLLDYPEDTAGRVMDTRIFALHGHVKTGQALENLRERGRGDIYFIKVVDEENRLSGQVDLRDLAFADASQSLEALARPVPAVVGPMDTREMAVQKFEETGVREIPVIDLDGHVLGVLRHDRLIGELRDDATVDIQTMVGASRDERALSTSWFAVRKRMPWLQINLLTAFLAASVVGMFESTIAKFTALAVLLPVVAGQSGNAGAQALAVTMRGLALREIHFGQWFRVVRKEVNAGLWNGIAIAITCAIGVFIWSGSLGLVMVIVTSMILSMIAAGIAGALVPITLARLGQDPAVASSIILTTVTDIAGFMSFLGIATLLASFLG